MDILVCSIAKNSYELCPQGQSNYKHAHQYYTTKNLISCSLSNCLELIDNILYYNIKSRSHFGIPSL